MVTVQEKERIKYGSIAFLDRYMGVYVRYTIQVFLCPIHVFLRPIRPVIRPIRPMDNWTGFRLNSENHLNSQSPAPIQACIVLDPDYSSLDTLQVTLFRILNTIHE